MTEGTHDQADALEVAVGLLRRSDNWFKGKSAEMSGDLTNEISAYLATRPAPVDPDIALSKEAVRQTIPYDSYWSTIHGVREQAERAALRAIKLAKEQQA